MAVTSNIIVVDKYEYADGTQARTKTQKFSDFVNSVKQSPSCVKALGALGVVCAIGSIVTLSISQAMWVDGPTEDHQSLKRGLLASAIGLGVSSVFSTVAWGIGTCITAKKEMTYGSIEIGVNTDHNTIKVEFGDVSQTLGLHESGFITKLRKLSLDSCRHAIANGDYIGDIYELYESVCTYVDEVRQTDSCMVFILRAVEEWMDHYHNVAFRDYQIKAGRNITKAAYSLSSSGTTSYDALAEEVNASRFTFSTSTESLEFEDEFAQNNSMEEIEL